MLVLTEKAEQDLEAFAELFGYKQTFLDALSVLELNTGAGRPGVVPQWREYPIENTQFVAAFAHCQGSTIILRVLPDRFLIGDVDEQSL